MSTNKIVNVLAPNGRRQAVKVTPNTTILQILEEVCHKQGFKAEEYDIRHHNHVLDTTSIMRFSGLPNNAQLEMSQIMKTREETNVILGLQLESGSRLTGNFLPTVNLWDVITTLCPEEADPNSNPVIIYMRREVSGLKNLSDTTLRHLGLTGGRAMLRFVHSTPEQLHRQANVSGLLTRRSSDSSQAEQSSMTKHRQPAQHQPEKVGVVEPPANRIVHNIIQAEPAAMEVDENVPTNTVPPATNVSNVTSYSTMSYNSSSQEATANTLASRSSDASETLINKHEGEIILLGERNAIVFNLAMAQSVLYEDFPEDFYDLTVEDARAIYRDIKLAREGLDDAPLVTNALRELQESKRVLSQLNCYKRSVLRIQFPDQMVLQGTFLPLETISVVMEFVRNYLDNPKMKFHLFTTPPKVILAPDSRLVEVNCVPSALVHFGLDKNQVSGKYLRDELHTQLTSLSAATTAACQSRGLTNTQSAEASSSYPSHSVEAASGSSSLPSTSACTSQPQAPRPDYGPSGKVPKWFKPMK